MRIGVKFCGGCNPTYDRMSVFNEIKIMFKDRCTFEFIKDNEVYDIIWVLSGCRRQCAANTDIFNNSKEVYFTTNNDGSFKKILELKLS